MRILVTGGPRTGKTTLAHTLGPPVHHTDDLVERGLEWSAVSDQVCGWISRPGPWVIEGCAAVRGLRKWLSANTGTPCERVIWLDRPHVELTRGQTSLRAACGTVWAGIVGDLRARGVRVEPG